MVTISEIISSQKVGLIHCQSTLIGGTIVSEICYMNDKSVRAVGVSNVQIKL